MKAKKTTNVTTTSSTKKPSSTGIGSLFDKENYKWMLIGLGVMLLGWILMSGGGSKDPNIFNKNEVYSPVRITIAPILIVAGLAIEVFALLRNPKKG
ncbi:MAG: DUF3098 domain-containing protein [Flavisolibacter sp.]